MEKLGKIFRQRYILEHPILSEQYTPKEVDLILIEHIVFELYGNQSLHLIVKNSQVNDNKSKFISLFQREFNSKI